MEVLLVIGCMNRCLGGFVMKGLNLAGEWYKVILGWGRGTENAGEAFIWDKLFREFRDPKPLEALVRLDLGLCSMESPRRRAGEVTMVGCLGNESTLLEEEERDLVLGRLGRDASLTSTVPDSSSYWTRYSGYTWSFLKITKMEGLQTSSTQLSYRLMSTASFGGGRWRLGFPWVCSPTRTRQANMALVPSWLVYLWEYEASLAK